MDVRITVGNIAKVTATFRDDAGALADPGTITAATLDPDGTDLTTYTYGQDPELTRTSQGIYVLEFELTEVGKWAVRFVGTGGAVTAAAESLVMVPDSPFVAP